MKPQVSNDQDEPRLFSEAPTLDLTVDRDMAALAWKQKIRSRAKPVDELPLFRRQKELF